MASVAASDSTVLRGARRGAGGVDEDELGRLAEQGDGELVAADHLDRDAGALEQRPQRGAAVGRFDADAGDVLADRRVGGGDPGDGGGLAGAGRADDGEATAAGAGRRGDRQAQRELVADQRLQPARGGEGGDVADDRVDDVGGLVGAEPGGDHALAEIGDPLRLLDRLRLGVEFLGRLDRGDFATVPRPSPRAGRRTASPRRRAAASAASPGLRGWRRRYAPGALRRESVVEGPFRSPRPPALRRRRRSAGRPGGRRPRRSASGRSRRCRRSGPRGGS